MIFLFFFFKKKNPTIQKKIEGEMDSGKLTPLNPEITHLKKRCYYAIIFSLLFPLPQTKEQKKFSFFLSFLFLFFNFFFFKHKNFPINFYFSKKKKVFQSKNIKQNLFLFYVKLSS